MADKRVSQLNPILNIQEDDLLPIVDTSEAQLARATKLQLERSFRLGELQGNTNNVAEGSNNLYWTNARFDNRLATKTSDNIVEGSNNKYLTPGNLLAALGGITTDNVAEGVTNLYWTQGRFNIAFNNKTTDNLTEGASNRYWSQALFNSALSAKTTSNLVEGSNLYWTQARFNNAFSAKTADDLADGVVNQWYTNAKVDARITLQKGVANGIATLDSTGKIPAEQISSLFVTDVYTVTTITERNDLLTNPGLQSGDIVIVTEATPALQSITYIYNGSAFVQLKTFDAVTSVNGKVGAVFLSTTSIPEGTNLYWTQARFDARFFSKNTDNLQEGIANLYFTNERVRLALNTFSINELADVNIIDPGTVPGHYLSWSGTEWVSTPPQAFGDTKDFKATGTDIHPDFAVNKLLGVSNRLTVTAVDPLSDGNEKLIFDVGNNIFDITQKTTNDIIEGANNLYYTDERADARINLRDIENILVITKNPNGPMQFATIVDAIEYINDANDASTNNRYMIDIGPGVFEEEKIILPSWCFIAGEREATIVCSINLDEDFIEMKSGSGIFDFIIDGPTDSGFSSVVLDTSTMSSVYNLRGLVFRRGWQFFRVENTTANNATAYLDNITIDSTSTATRLFKTTSSSTGKTTIEIENFTYTSTNPVANIEVFSEVSGINTKIAIRSFLIDIDGGTIQTGLLVEDGALLTAFSGYVTGNIDVALLVPNVGAGPRLKISSVAIESQVNDAVILNPGTTGVFDITGDIDKFIIDPVSVLKVNISNSSVSSVGSLIIGDIVQGPSADKVVDISTLIRTTSTLGVIEGGVLTDSGSPNTLNVSGGRGFLQDAVNNFTKEVVWSSQTINIPTGEFRWITVDLNGNVQAVASPPSNLRTVLLLGRVGALFGSISFIEQIGLRSNHYSNYVEEFFRTALGPVYSSGSIVTENSLNPLQLDISSGQYYYGINRYQPSGGSNKPFIINWRDGSGGVSRLFNQLLVPVKLDDDSGTLQDPTAGYYVKHSFWVVGEGINESYGLVIGQQEFSDLTLAEQGDLPLPPAVFNESFTLIASIIIQEGNSNIVQIRDERPVLGFKASGIAASTFHGNLLGLLDDDHPQYLLVNGTRTMSGNLNMGGQSIENVNLVDGIDVSAHAARHLPNGADALATAAAISVSATTTNTEGNANSFARSNHTHNILTGVVSTQNAGATNAEGVSANLARADHTHQIPTAAAVTISLSSVNTEGVSTSFARADHTHAINLAFGVPVGLSATTTNTEGVSPNVARADHTHDLATGNVSSQGAGNTNAEGTSANLARADHQHQMLTAAAIEITDSTNAEGTSGSLARADHRHAHGNRGGGSLHAAATTSVAGFMSAADKTKLDGLNTSTFAQTKVFASSTVNRQLATEAQLDNMILTPAAGRYLVIATVYLQSTSTNPIEGHIFLAKNGVSDPETIGIHRNNRNGNSGDINIGHSITIETVLDLNGTDTVSVRWAVSTAATNGGVNAGSRKLEVIRLN